MRDIDIERFIANCITNRERSLFSGDIDNNKEILSNAITGKSILVIGGAGTIGSSFIKALLPFKPDSLIVVDYNENGLTELTRDLRSQNIFMPKHYITYPFDFGSKVFEKLFLSQSFDIVACFAAHKHVRSEKDHLAIEAMIHNNVFNTKKLVELAMIRPPAHLFSVSTDKAANPVNVMGASKKLMENVLLAYSDQLKITTARFANVAFSNGSLLAGFIERLNKKQPLSSPFDVKRYFVSPEESGQLCLLACIVGKSGDIFFPKLEESQMKTFSEIADLFLSELGFSSKQCASEDLAKEAMKSWTHTSKEYPVYYFKSDTSGEKSFEEFFTINDNPDFNLFDSLGVVRNQVIPNVQEVSGMVSSLQQLFDSENLNKHTIVDSLSQIITGFQHIETGKSLDGKM